jgi:hypothetical protein
VPLLQGHTQWTGGERKAALECVHANVKSHLPAISAQSDPSAGVVMANSLKSQCFQPHVTKKTMLLGLPQFQFGEVLLLLLLFKRERSCTDLPYRPQLSLWQFASVQVQKSSCFLCSSKRNLTHLGDLKMKQYLQNLKKASL